MSMNATKKIESTSHTKEQVVLIGLVTGMQKESVVQEYLDELEFLAETAGAITMKRFIQKLPQPHSSTFIGKGKIEEIRNYIQENDIRCAIFDDDLSGKQTNHLEAELKVKIIDRSSLILDIFAQRARTLQAKTQVELAQLQYLLPRLRGLWTHLERQRGGIGMRGPGEKEIETDRRILRDRISQLKKELLVIDRQNQTQRKNRETMVRVALVGYTNAGKSTIMNVCSKSDVFAEDKLFATLDTTVRKVVWERMPFLLSDTVGFIRKLPHHLIESFKSTLDETRESDLLIHVVDISHPQYEDHIRTVLQTLADLEVHEKQQIMVFNKIDAYRKLNMDAYVDKGTEQEIEREISNHLSNTYQHPNIFISAKTGEGIPAFRKLLTENIEKIYRERYPYVSKQW